MSLTNQKDQSDSLESLLVVGPAIIAAAVSGIGLYDRLKDIAAALDQKGPSWNTLAPLVALLLTVWLAFAWYAAGREELQLIRKYLGDYLPIQVFAAFPTTMAIGLLLVTMAYFSRNAPIYAGAFLAYQIATSLVHWVIKGHMRDVLDRARKLGPDLIDPFRSYYVDYPYRYVDVGGLVVASLALVFAIQASPGPALLVPSGWIVVSEVFMWVFRRRLHRSLIGVPASARDPAAG